MHGTFRRCLRMQIALLSVMRGMGLVATRERAPALSDDGTRAVMVQLWEKIKLHGWTYYSCVVPKNVVTLCVLLRL